LAISSALNGGVAEFIGDTDADKLYLRVDAPGELQFSTDGSSFSNDLDANGGTLTVSSGSQITVNLGAGDDRLFVEASLSNKLNETGASLNFDGQSGTDALSGPDSANTWELTSADGGELNDRIAFVRAENITGGSQKDEVTVEVVDGFNGVIDGGSGELVIVAGDSVDTLHVKKDVLDQGDIRIGPDLIGEGGAGIVVHSDITISSRRISGSDHLNDGSSGDSGDIRVNGREITVESGVNILAHVEDSSSHLAGSITLTASATDVSCLPFIAHLSGSEAGISVANARIQGGDVSLQAVADVKSQLLSEWVKTHTPGWLGTSLSMLEDGLLGLIPIPLYVTSQSAGTSIELDGSTIVSSGSVLVEAKTDVASTAKVISVKSADSHRVLRALDSISVGYSRAKGSAEAILRGTTQIHADNNVIITADAKTKAKVQARSTANIDVDAPANSKAIGGSLAITSSDTTSHAIVNQGVSITAGGNVDVRAKGTVENNASSSAPTYVDGLGGLSLTFAFDDTDVRAKVDGTITATGSEVVARELDLSSVAGDNNTITLPDHGLQEGDEVVYIAEDPTVPENLRAPLDAIGGLVSGETYTVRVIDKDTLKLARVGNLDLDNSGVDPNATHTFNPRVAVEFDPSAAVNLDDDTIEVQAHGLATGNELDYAVGDQDNDEAIGGLVNLQRYYAVKVDDNHFKLATTEDNAKGGTAIDLIDEGQGSTHVFVHEQAAKPFNPANDIDSPANTITLSDHGFTEGDALVYRTDPNIVSRVPTAHTTVFDPATFAIPFDPTDTAQTIVDLDADAIHIPAHGLVRGQKVTYYDGGGTAIGGLTDEAGYFVIVMDEDNLRLASSYENALAGTVVDLVAGATGTEHRLETSFVDIDADRLILEGHDLETGQKVTYSTEGAAAVGGLTDGADYYAISIDDGTIQLAASRADASAGNAIDLSSGGAGSQHALRTSTVVTTFDAGRTTPVVDTTADTIELPGHGLATGDEITYHTSGGTSIGGLADGQTYFVIKVDANTIKLAQTKEESTNETAIDLKPGATLGSDLHGLSPADAPDTFLSFDPTLDQLVDPAADTIEIIGHGFETGDSVTYLTGGEDAIGGLSDGAEYQVIRIDDDTIQLAASTDPTTPIDLGPGATGRAHGLERLAFVLEPDREIRGLENGEVYYVMVVDKDTIRLAANQLDALAIDLDPDQATGNTHTLRKANEVAGIGVSATLNAKNLASSGAKVGGQPGRLDPFKKKELLTSWTRFKSIMKGDAKKLFRKGANEKTYQSNDVFAGAASVTWERFDHDVVAMVGAHADLNSSMDVSVRATTTQTVQLGADGSVKSEDTNKKAAIAGAVGVGFFDNNVQAIVDGGAKIDSSRNLVVSSDLTYPFVYRSLVPTVKNLWSDFSWGKLKQGVIDIIVGTIMADFKNMAVTSQSQAKDAAVSIAGSLGIANYDNDSEAIIRQGAQINQDPAYRDANQRVSVDAQTNMELVNLGGLLGGWVIDFAGLKGWLWDKKGSNQAFPWWRAEAGTVAIGGVVLLQYFDNTTVAKVEDDVRIWTGADGGLYVNSQEDVFSFEFAHAGGKSGKLGLAGSVSYLDQVSQTLAVLENGVNIQGGPVSVTADDDTNHTVVVGGLLSAKTAGIGASVGITEVNRTTEAIVGGDSARAFGKDGVDGADDTIRLPNHGFQAGEQVTYGSDGDAIGGLTDGDTYFIIRVDDDTFSLAQTEADATAENPVAIDLDPSGAGVNHTLKGTVSIDAAAIDMRATAGGNVRTLAFTGTMVSNVPQPQQPAEEDALNGETLPDEADISETPTTSGVGIAGDAAVNMVTDVTRAYINDNGTIAVDGDVLLEAVNDTGILAITGAATLAKTTDTSVGIAGSFSKNDVTATTQAFIAGAQITADNLTVSARQEGSVFAFSAGVSGTATAQRGVAIAGSLSWNKILNTTEAFLDRASVTTTGDIVVSANDDSTQNAIGGGVGLSLGGKLGFGAGVAVNRVQATTRAAVVGADQDKSTLHHAGRLEVRADNDADVSAAGFTLGTGALGVAGTAGVNLVNNTTEALVEHTQHSAAAGDVVLLAHDHSDVNSLAGALGIGKELAGIGIGFAWNKVQNPVVARVERSKLSPASLSVTADSEPDLFSVSAAGAADFNKTAIAGSVSVDTARNTTDAHISNGSEITSTGSVLVDASDGSTIEAYSGGVAVAKGGSVGAAVGVNKITNTITAFADGSNVASSAGNVAIRANSTPEIWSLTAGGAGAAKFALGGSVAVNTIRNTIDARIKDANGTNGVEGKAVRVTAIDAGEVKTGTGGLAFAKSAAVGAAVSTDDINDNVTARIENSKVKTTGGDLEVLAKSDLAVVAVTVGGAGAADFSLGGSVSVNKLGGTVDAHISADSDVDAAGTIRVQATEDRTGTDAFDIGANYVFHTGDAAAYTNGGGTSVGGLTDGTTYYAIVDRFDTSRIRLASSREDAEAGIPIDTDPTAASGDAHRLTSIVTFDPTSSDVMDDSAFSDLIDLGYYHGLATGEAVVYHRPDGETAIGNLEHGKTYFVIVDETDTNKVKLAATQADAFDGETIDIDPSAATGIEHRFVQSATFDPAVEVEQTNERTTIRAIAGGVGISGRQAVGVSVAVNEIDLDVKAHVDSGTVDATGSVVVGARSNADVSALAIGGAGVVGGAGGGSLALAGAGSYSVNKVNNLVDAQIRNGATVTATGSVSVSAEDHSRIDADAGGVGIAILVGNAGVGIAVGAAASTNTIANEVFAYIDGSSVEATNGSVTVEALEDATIEAVTIGAAGGATLGGGGGFSFAGAGAGSGNRITNTVEAVIKNSGTQTDPGVRAGDAVTISARDTSRIEADAGGFAVSLAFAGGGTGAGSVGGSVAANYVINSVLASIDSSSVTAVGNIDLTGTETTEITAWTIGGAAAVTGGGGGSGSGALAGAYSDNRITTTVKATIASSNAVNSTGGAIRLLALDDSTVNADAGGFAVALAFAGGGAGAGSVGVSEAENDITNTVLASINSSTVTAAGNILLSAKKTAEINAWTVGGALAGSGAGGGAGAFAGAGAFSHNAITSTVKATIVTNSSVQSSGGAVTLSATDDSTINADAGGMAVAVAGAGGGAGAGSVGGSVAHNDIAGTVIASIDGSTVSAAGSVELAATENARIDAWTMAGAVAISGAGGGSFSGAGAGADSTNTIRNTVEALVRNNGSVTAGGSFGLVADDTSVISAQAGGGSLAISGAGGGSASVAVAGVDATNNIQNRIRSYIDKSTVASSHDVLVRAKSTARIDSFAVAISLSAAVAPAGFSFSGGGADATNTITNTIEAYIGNSSDVDATNDITVTATDDATIRSDVASGMLSVAIAGASIGVSLTDNTVNNTVKAYIDADVTSTGGDIRVNADSLGQADALAVATSISVSVGVAGSGAGATSTVKGPIEAYFGNGAVVTAENGTAFVRAASDARVDAETRGGSVASLVAISGMVSTAKAEGSTKAYAGEGVTVTSKGLDVSAGAANTVNALSDVMNVGIIGGAGATATAQANRNVEAFVGPEGEATEGSSATIITVTGGDVRVAARSASTVDADAEGWSGGLLTAGMVKGDAKVGGTTNASVGDATKIVASGLQVVADATNTVAGEVDGLALAVGLAGAGNNATTIIEPALAATIGDNTDINVTGDILVRSKAFSTADAEADGVSVAGALATGASFGEATIRPTMTTAIGGSKIRARNVTVGTLHNNAQSFAASTALSNSSDTIDFGYDHGFVTGQAVEYSAGGGEALDGLEDGGTYYVAVVDATKVKLASSRENALASSAMDIGNSNATGDSHSLRTGFAKVRGHASGGAVLVGILGSRMIANVQPAITTSVGGTGLDLVAAGDVNVISRSAGDTRADSSGVSIGGLVGVGTIDADARSAGTIRTRVDGGTRLEAANLTVTSDVGDFEPSGERRDPVAQGLQVWRHLLLRSRRYGPCPRQIFLW